MTTKKTTTEAETEAQAGVPASVLRAQAAGKEVPVTLAHYWTDPDTGKAYRPGDKVTLPADTAASLGGSGYLVREDTKDK